MTNPFSSSKSRIFLLLALIAGLWSLSQPVLAQDSTAVNQPGRDPEARLRIRGGERIDFVFTRGILLRGDLPAQYPMDPGRSGSYSLGMALGLHFGRGLAMRFEPRLTWHNVFYSQTPEKTYPTDSNGLFLFEKERGFYIEMPIGFKFNLARNTKDKVRLYLELGAQGGILAGSMYKRRSLLADGTKYTEKFHDVPGLNPLRYGFYGRIGTKIFAAHVFYRISEIFLQEGGGTSLPDFHNLELGFAFVF